MTDAPSIWREIGDAIRGRPRDYTTGSLVRAALLLAIPMVLEMMMQALFSIADIYFVGRIGAEAQAVVGLTDSLLALVFAVAIGLSMGATAMVARRIGEGKPREAATTAVQAIGVGLLFSVVSGAAAVYHATWLLEFLGNDPELAVYGTRFAAIMLGGNVTVTLLFLINAIFRGAGQPTFAMWSLAIANGLNILFDPILIFGFGPIPAMGLEGAAIATTGSRAVGVLFQLWALTRPGLSVRIGLFDLKLRPSIMARLIRVSGIGVVQFLIGTTSFVWMLEILSHFGAKVIAGYTIAIRILIFVLLPVWGVGNAAATLVGMNLGAGKPERAEKAVWLTARWNSGTLLLVMVVFLALARVFVAPFSTDPEAVALGARCLQIVSLSYPFWGFGIVTLLAFNGAGDTSTPTWINLFCYWLFQIPVAWWAGLKAGFGADAVFATMTVAQALLAVISVALFRRGTWKKRVV